MVEEGGAVKTRCEDGRRSARVVGQDKESGSLWPAARDFLRRRASFFAGYRDLRGVSVTRKSRVAMTRAITAPLQARRKPFGRSGWPAGRVAAALVLGLAALGIPAALGRLFKLRITLRAGSGLSYTSDRAGGTGAWLSRARRLSGGRGAGREGHRRAAG